MAKAERTLEELALCGNAPALDFVNTVHSRVPPDRDEYLRSMGDLVAWGVREGLLPRHQARGLLAGGEVDPEKARALLEEVLELREALYRLFLVVIRDEAVHREDLETLNHWSAWSSGRRRLRYRRGRFSMEWGDGAYWERILGPIVQSAVELLTEAPAARLRECPMPEGGCGWLFLDTSKNGTRRWCRMETCGNIAKARRHRARSHPGRA